MKNCKTFYFQIFNVECDEILVLQMFLLVLFGSSKKVFGIGVVANDSKGLPLQEIKIYQTLNFLAFISCYVVAVQSVVERWYFWYSSNFRDDLPLQTHVLSVLPMLTFGLEDWS